MKRIAGVLLLLAAVLFPSGAQTWSVSTNVLDYANLITLNAEGSYAFARRWTVTAGVRYNPFSFHRNGLQFQNRKMTFSAGVRYWPWHTFSGWWIASKLQYQEYNAGGIFSQRTEEGDKFGLALAAGYTCMINSHLNLEFGLGLWGGVRKYKVYDCPVCGLTIDSGTGAFILPNELIIGICYVF